MFGFNSNARFLPDVPYPAALLRDLHEGLRYVYQGEEKTLAWRTTFLELDMLPFVHRAPHDRFGWPVFRCDVPLRLGSLEVGGVQINVPDLRNAPSRRLEVPFDHLPLEVRLDGDGADNYWQVKAYFAPVLGKPATIWERDDQMHVEWTFDGLQIGLTYWFTSGLSKQELGYASLLIGNNRIFPEYFTDAYTEAFDLDAPGLVCQTFDLPPCTIPGYYRSSQWVRFTPEAVRKRLQQKNHLLAVWYDPQHHKLGFAKDEQFCLMVELTGDQRFVLELVDRDRGHYTHDLEGVRPEGQRETVISSEVGALEEVVRMLKEVGFLVTREGRL